MDWKIIIPLCLLYAFLNVSGSGLIKSELSSSSLDSVKDYFDFLCRYKVLAGIVVNFASVLVAFKALSLGKFSYVVPISTGILFMLTVLLGILVFEDRLSKISYGGLILILTGIVLMSLDQ